MGGDLNSPLLYGRPIGKVLVVGLRLKWRSSFSRTCLYSVSECGRQTKIVISVWTPYREVVGSRIKTTMAIEFFPYMSIQRM